MSASRAVVVGGGLIGLSIARALTERGLTDVLVLERGLLASGGTGKSSGIVRAHYGVPSIAAMAWRSLPVFEALGAEVGFRQVGYTVVVGEENAGPLKDNTAMHQGLGIEGDEHRVSFQNRGEGPGLPRGDLVGGDLGLARADLFQSGAPLLRGHAVSLSHLSLIWVGCKSTRGRSRRDHDPPPACPTQRQPAPRRDAPPSSGRV